MKELIKRKRQTRKLLIIGRRLKLSRKEETKVAGKAME
jgi:hypothetical protein